MDDGRALFLQIAESIADAIVDGDLQEDDRVPSTNELAAFHRINPATAAKGVAVLVDQGVIYKQRGVGMFVAAGAREHLRAQRRRALAERFIEPLLAEARTLGLGADEVCELVRSRFDGLPASARPAPTTGPATIAGPSPTIERTTS